MSDTENPWVSQSTTGPSVNTPAPPPEVVAARGPQSPQAGVLAPADSLLLPSVQVSGWASVFVSAAHGGAGGSTLARLIPGARSVGTAWPLFPGYKVPVIVVARSNLSGLRSAQAAAQQWAAGLVPGVALVGLVVMADAPGKLPRELRDLAQVVSGGFPRAWQIPWVPAWRTAEVPGLDTAIASTRRAFDELNLLVNKPST